MGTFRLFALVMAFVSPLVTVSGWISILIGFGGAAAPVMMLVAMLLVGVFSVGFVTMGQHMKNPGAFYSYVTASLGRAMGLGAGFVAIIAYVLLGLSSFTFFGVAASAYVARLGGPQISWYWYGLLLWIVVSIFGYFHVEVSARVLLVAMAIEIIVVLVFDFAIFSGRTAPSGGITLEPFSWHAISGGVWSIGLLFALLMFNGFEGTAAFREEVRDPARTIGRATLFVVAFVGIFFFFATWALLSYFGTDQAHKLGVSDPVGMFATALSGSVGNWLVSVAGVLLFTSIFAATVSIHSILSRYIFSLGVDRVLPARFGAVHPRHKSPYIAAAGASALFLLAELPFVLTDADATALYGQLGGTGGYAYLLLFTLVSLAVLVYFRRQRGAHSAGIWVSTVAPIVSLIAMATLLVVGIQNFTTLTGGSGVFAFVLQAVVWGSAVLGITLALIYRKKRPDAYARIGRREAKPTATTVPASEAPLSVAAQVSD